MSECRLISYMVPDGPPYFASGSARAITRCETHDWSVDGGTMSGGLCPIGRIEQARDEAIQKIREAANG